MLLQRQRSMKMLNKPLCASFNSIDELVLADPNVSIKINALANKNSGFPSRHNSGIILYGPYGTGKTTIAELVPQIFESRVGNPNPAYYEFVRCGVVPSGIQMLTNIDQATDLVSPCSLRDLHYVILDEADNLSSEAMKRLKGLMNKQSTVFILTTNNIKAIDKGVQNRSTLFHIDKPSADQWLTFVKQHLDNLNDDLIMELIRTTDLSGRDITSAIYRALNKN